MRRTIPAAVATLALLGVTPNGSDSALAALHFRNIGPLDGRIDAVSGVDADPATYYAGGLGGLFKSADGGITWQSIFNNKPVSSVNAIAVASSQPSVVYLGTGEANLRNDIAFGDGVWRSGDAGKTWSHLGLDATGQIAAIAVDPSDANRAYVAALGDAYRATADRGIYRTIDGGASWEKVLYTDERTGGSSIAIDPADTKHLLAGMWEGWRTPYHLTSGGPTDGIYQSTDRGDHWSRLQGNGLPTRMTGRIAIAFAPSNPKRVYALIESSQGTLWRSDDGGTHWAMVNASHGIDQRPFYFTSLAVDPQNANHIFFMSVQIWESTDGGKTAKEIHSPPGGDYHQMWIDPRNAARIVAGGDDGAAVSLNAGKTWLYALLPIAQSYHVDTDDRIPYTICSEDQDAGSACGPSNNLAPDGITPDEFFYAGGGESGWILFDRRDSNLIYGDSYQGAVTQYDRRTKQARRIDVWPVDAMGWPAAPLRYRFQWTAPLAISLLHPHRLYMGADRIFQTDNGGETWRAISPDLTRNDKIRQQISGTPITPDNTSVEYYNVVFSIGPSPLRDGEIWAGTDDGRVWLTRDGGVRWSEVTPAAFARSDRRWLRVDYVEPSPFDAGTAYVAADAHKWGDRRPQLFVTHDYGKTWAAISGGLPQESYTRMIRADPVRRGMLYAGTETGLWYSFDDGSSWTRFSNGFPVVPVYDFVVQRRFDDLVVGTHGRGIWILDDLHALQELTPEIRAEALHLFSLRDAYRYRLHPSESVSAFAGENPRYGADVNFWLSAVPLKSNPIKIQVFDGTRLIRTIEVKKPVTGLNRVSWNLRYDSLDPPKGYVPWAGGGFTGPLVLPGTYTIRIIANGHLVQGGVRVVEDPRSRASRADLQRQLDFLMRVRADISAMTRAIERLQSMEKRNPSLKPRIDALLQELYNPEVTQSEDALRVPERVYGRLSFLASGVASADASPTQAQYEVLTVLEAQARALLAEANSFAS
ncbi:MAG TPA: hypothetical protein VIX60_02570 [Candidatus Cybelea sp.]